MGLPNPDSMAALQQLYGVTPEDVATARPEEVIVEKNRKLHRIGQIVC